MVYLKREDKADPKLYEGWLTDPTNEYEDSDYAVKPVWEQAEVGVGDSYWDEGGTTYNEYETRYNIKSPGVLRYDTWQKYNLDTLQRESQGFLDLDMEYDKYIYDAWNNSNENDNTYRSQLSNIITTHRNTWADKNVESSKNAAQLNIRRSEALLEKARRQQSTTGGSQGTVRANTVDNSLTSVANVDPFMPSREGQTEGTLGI